MLVELRKSPVPLQKQILQRFGLSAVCGILFITILIAEGDVYVMLPFAGVVAFLFVNTIMLIYYTLNKEYVIISGICVDTNVTLLKKKPKTVEIFAEGQTIVVSLRNRRKAMAVGDKIDVYVLRRSQIYEKDKKQILYSYLAMNVKAVTHDCASE